MRFGFQPQGEGKEDVGAGAFELKGELQVNSDGGLKWFGHPLCASGLRTIYKVHKQLQGKAGARQIKKIDLGLTHNLGGHPSIFTSAVAIFEQA